MSSTTKAILTDDVEASAKHAARGGLVAFPTETVYGLGCHALDVSAVQSVFDAKERPLTDPLIVHVLDSSAAFELWKTTSESREGTILQALLTSFWPGPLTLVAAADAATVPSKITAGTGYVAVRSPSHATARALLQAAGIPMAAPSANKFGHVSPTTAQHVWDDLRGEHVWILRGEPCSVGVESTVAKLEVVGNDDNFVLTVLRQGAVSAEELSTCLKQAGLLSSVRVQSTIKATADHIPTVAPGQMLRHYSPHVPSYLVSDACSQREVGNSTLSKAVILDLGGQLVSWKRSALAYRDLSATADSAEAANGLFDTLRWAEQVKDATCILFPAQSSTDALGLALRDRLTRAASGVVVDDLSAIKDQAAGKLPT